jgi:hypothetical protein
MFNFGHFLFLRDLDFIFIILPIFIFLAIFFILSRNLRGMLIDFKVVLLHCELKILIVCQVKHRNKTRRNSTLQFIRNPGLSHLGIVAVLRNKTKLQRFFLFWIRLVNELILDFYPLHLRNFSLDEVPHHILEDLDLHFIVSLGSASIMENRE